MATIKETIHYSELKEKIPNTYLIPIRFSHKNKNSTSPHWEYECVCGKTIIARINNVGRSESATTSCGCKGRGKNKIFCDFENNLKKCSNKACRRYGEFLTLDQFRKYPKGHLGTTDLCSECDNLRVLKNRYKFFNLEAIVDFVNSKNNKCEICYKNLNLYSKDRKNTTNIDHCHKTNKIRGLLCGDCNTILGMAKDSLQTLKNAISYLEKNGST